MCMDGCNLEGKRRELKEEERKRERKEEKRKRGRKVFAEND